MDGDGIAKAFGALIVSVVAAAVMIGIVIGVLLSYLF